MPDPIARYACPFRPRRSGGPDFVWIAAIILTSTGFFRPGVRLESWHDMSGMEADYSHIAR